jgi:hypothetical protein
MGLNKISEQAKIIEHTARQDNRIAGKEVADLLTVINDFIIEIQGVASI